jgi:hypothetical protein
MQPRTRSPKQSLSADPSNTGESVKAKAGGAAIRASDSDLTDLDGSFISDREGESPGKRKTIASAEQRAKQLHDDRDVLDQNPFLDSDNLRKSVQFSFPSILTPTNRGQRRVGEDL